MWVGSPYTHEFIRVRDGGEITDRVRYRAVLRAPSAALMGGRCSCSASIPCVARTGSGQRATVTPVLHGDVIFDGGRIWTQTVARARAGWP